MKRHKYSTHRQVQWEWWLQWVVLIRCNVSCWMCSAGSSIRTFVMRPHMLRKSCCLITGYRFPWGPTAAPLIPLTAPFTPLPQSCPWYSPLTAKPPNLLPLSLLPLSILPFKPHQRLLLFPISRPPFMRFSSFLRDRLISQMATGSSVAQLGINKHLDISLLCPLPFALFRPFDSSSHKRRTQASLSTLKPVFSVTLAEYKTKRTV